MRRNSLGKWVALGILILPSAEIAVFLLVAHWLGLHGAVFLLLATSLIGAGVLWYVGRIVISRFLHLAAQRDSAAVRVGTGGLLTVLGGILLVLPGFITDTIGLILVIPSARRWIARYFTAPDQRGPEPQQIDLDTSEWRRLSEPRPKRRTPRQTDKSP